jgi:hypothetical protein
MINRGRSCSPSFSNSTTSALLQSLKKDLPPLAHLSQHNRYCVFFLWHNSLTLSLSLSFSLSVCVSFSLHLLQRTRRVQKFTRAVSGMDLAALKKKQSEKKNKRESQRKLQLQEIKDRKKKAKADRKKNGGGSKAKAIKGGRGKN